jgi:hypothetical protein
VPEPVAPPSLRLPIGLATLGAEARAEWRADEAMWTATAAQRWAHARRIDDVVREYAARGDRVCIGVADRTFEGAVVAVGDDRIDVATVSGTVSVHTAFADSRSAIRAPITIRRSHRARSGGTRLPAALLTFRARLLELEDGCRSIRLGVFHDGAEHVGALVVGDDHVIVSGDDDVIVPSAWVAYVAAAPGEGA